MPDERREQPIALRLRRPEVLKEALDEAPTFESEEFLLRLDRIARDASSDPRRRIDRVRLYCDETGPEDPAESGAALGPVWSKLCAGKALAYRRQAQATRRDGWVALRYGALCFVAALALSVGIEQLEPLPRWINRPLSEGFLIASWVSLWRPIELLLYEWLPFARMAQAFDRLGGLPVSIAPPAPRGALPS